MSCAGLCLTSEQQTMPIAFEIDHATQRVMVTATGDIRIEDMAALVNRLAELRVQIGRAHV